jgi:hypothetical protein
MSTRTLRRGIAALLGVGVFAAVGCGGSPASPSGQSAVAVNGSWTGTAILPNAYSTTMTLQQSGSDVSGTMRIAGALNGPITGTVPSGTRTFLWRANHDCEVWSGTLTVDGSGNAMQGPLTIDRTGCVPATSSGSGTLNLQRH